MTTRNDLLASIDETPLDLLLQRCADGELSETDERQLLARLDFQPDLWRRLALLFIEQRVMGQACRPMALLSAPATAALPDSEGASVPRPVTTQPSRRRSVPGLSWIALGLAVAAAFGLGRWQSAGSPEPNREMVQQTVPPTNVPAAPESEHRATVMGTPDGISTGWPESAHSDDTEPAPPPAMFVNLLVPGSDQPVPVPVYPAPATPAVWRPFSEPAISEQEAESLRRAGYHVASQREVLRWQSPEGLEVMLPVESVDVRLSRY